MAERSPAGPARWPWLVGLLLACGLLRLFIAFETVPSLRSDTVTYLRLAEALAAGDLSQDDGARMPVYPLFLNLWGRDPERVRWAQLALGLLTTAGLFQIAWRLAPRPGLAALVGASYGLNLAQVRFESSLVTEALTTGLIIGAVVVAAGMLGRGRPPGPGRVALLGALAALAPLTRPMYLPLPFLMLLPVLAGSPGRRVRRAGLYLAFALLPLLGWCLFNQARFGYFGLTTLTGYNLTNHSGAYIEDAPDRYAAIRDLYLAERRANGGEHRMVIWRVYHRLPAATGESPAQLSKILTRMSLELFARHPAAYLRSVAWGWVHFWNTQGWWRWDEARRPATARGLGWAWRAQKFALVAVNFLFLLLLARYAIRWRAIRQVDPGPVVRLMVLVVGTTSILQALMESGDAARYSISTQPLVCCTVAIAGSQLLTRRRLRAGPPGPGR